MVEVARIASGKSDEALEATGIGVGVDGKSVGGEVLRHNYNLRPDFQVTIPLPVDLTHSEAARLADFVRTLPFSGAADRGDPANRAAKMASSEEPA